MFVWLIYIYIILPGPGKILKTKSNNTTEEADMHYEYMEQVMQARMIT